MTATVTPIKPAAEYVDEIDCTYCDVPIKPTVEDGDTALECCCGSWHHYDCAGNCSAYADDLAYSMAEDVASDERGGA